MGLTQAKNFTVSTTWAPLSDLLDTDYETTDDYIIHTNPGPLDTCLCFTYRTGTPPTDKDKGSVYPPYSDIEVTKNTGGDIYLKGSIRPVDIEITPTVLA